MQLSKRTILSIIMLLLSAPAMAERGDTSVSAFGNVTENSVNLNGGVGFMFTDSLKTSVNLSLMHTELGSSDTTTNTLFLEAQYYFGNFYQAESFLLSVGAGLLLTTTDSTSSEPASSSYDYSALDSVNDSSSSYCSSFSDPSYCESLFETTFDSSSAEASTYGSSSSSSDSSDLNTGYHVFLQANQFFSSYENASIFYRLLAQSVDGGDATTTFTFGVEIYF